MNQTVLSAKKQLVSEIADKFKEASSAVVVEYRGLSVAEVNELRNLLREEEVELKVYKNTMVERAVEECGFDELKDSLKGPNAFAFSKDATAPSRVLAKFAKKHEHLVLKSGVVEGKVVGIDTIKELSSLPNREGMLSMLLSCLQSPIRSFACVVKAVSEAKENGEPVNEAPVEAAAEEAPVAETPVEEKTEVKEEVVEAVAETTEEKKEGE